VMMMTAKSPAMSANATDCSRDSYECLQANVNP